MHVHSLFWRGGGVSFFFFALLQNIGRSRERVGLGFVAGRGLYASSANVANALAVAGEEVALGIF